MCLFEWLCACTEVFKRAASSGSYGSFSIELIDAGEMTCGVPIEFTKAVLDQIIKSFIALDKTADTVDAKIGETSVVVPVVVIRAPTGGIALPSLVRFVTTVTEASRFVKGVVLAAIMVNPVVTRCGNDVITCRFESYNRIRDCSRSVARNRVAWNDNDDGIPNTDLSSAVQESRNKRHSIRQEGRCDEISIGLICLKLIVIKGPSVPARCCAG